MANEAMIVHLPLGVSIASVDGVFGWSSLYTAPEAKQWQIVVNGEDRRGGIRIDEAVCARDIGSSVVPLKCIEVPIETRRTALQRLLVSRQR